MSAGEAPYGVPDGSGTVGGHQWFARFNILASLLDAFGVHTVALCIAFLGGSRMGG